MEPARLPINRALPKPSEAVVIYKGGWQFVVALGVTSCFAGPPLLVAIAGNHRRIDCVALFFLVTYGAMALRPAFVASQHCSRVELYRNGKLVLHYFVRRSVTTWIEEVSEIDGDDYDGEWFVSFNRGRFRMSCNRSATSLVHALMRGKPTIALSGYTLPEL